MKAAVLEGLLLEDLVGVEDVDWVEGVLQEGVEEGARMFRT